MMVLALVGLVTASAVAGVRSFAKTELRSATTKLAGAIRYLFDRASTTGKVHRLVVDFEEGRYWAEVSDDRFYLPRERETEESRAREEEELGREEEARSRQEAADPLDYEAAYDYTRYQPTDWKPKRARFAAFNERAFRPTQVKGAKLAGMFTPRLSQPIATGRGYLYFFPLGQTEPALFHLSDERGETFYSLLVHPLNGRVRIHNGYVEPRVEEQYDDEGNRIEEP
jgi:general secretion pathway protein H